VREGGECRKSGKVFLLAVDDEERSGESKKVDVAKGILGLGSAVVRLKKNGRRKVKKLAPGKIR